MIERQGHSVEITVAIQGSEFRLYRAASAKLTEHAHRHSARAGAVTVPVYPREITRQPESIGTGLLLALGQTRFLLTAGHVLDKVQMRDFAVPFRNHLLPVTGPRTRLSAPGTTANDHFDVGFIRLTGRSWDSTELSGFLALDEVALSLALSPRDAFAIIGYPVTKQPRSVTGADLLSRAYRLAAIGRPASSYQALGYDPQVNLLLGFEKEKVWDAGGRHTAPDPYGISGGGVWHFGSRLGDASTPPRLAGVGIEWQHKTKDKVLVATRMDQIFDAIVNRYPDLNPTVQSARLSAP